MRKVCSLGTAGPSNPVPCLIPPSSLTDSVSQARLTCPGLSIKGHRVSQSPRRPLHSLSRPPLPALAGDSGSDPGGEGVYPGPSQQADLVACLFKSQVIWEE